MISEIFTGKFRNQKESIHARFTQGEHQYILPGTILLLYTSHAMFQMNQAIIREKRDETREGPA